MRPDPRHAVADEAEVRRLVAEHPWATLVSSVDGELVASHYPVLLDPAAEGLALLTHLGRPDERLHALGRGAEILVVVAGPHGYVSPSWYGPEGVRAPTWNFSVAHLHGVPEVLGEEENLRSLERLVAHFERHVDEPVWLEPEVARRLGPGTVGLRIPVARWTAKAKMSQDKDPESRRGVLAALRGDGPYANPALAAEMERALGGG